MPKRRLFFASQLGFPSKQCEEVPVYEKGKAQLQCRIYFFEAYKKRPRDSEGKNEMLESFTMDKTCQRWADRQKVVENTQVEKATAQSGYLSRDWFEITTLFHTYKHRMFHLL